MPPRTGSLRIGTSGWTYQHWKERFYPPKTPQTRWLEFYASQFDTVEVNASFYHLPAAATFSGWAQRTPEQFFFAVKAWRQITHWRRLINCEEPLNTFLERAQLLGDKLGPILFQYPPRWPVNPEVLENFIRLLPDNFRYAFEFRDPSWLREDVYGQLLKAGIALCRSSSPHFPDANVVTAPFVYLRMHGSTTNYSSCYSDKELDAWAHRIRDWCTRSLDVYIYFNNDVNAYAIQNAQTLLKLLIE